VRARSDQAAASSSSCRFLPSALRSPHLPRRPSQHSATPTRRPWTRRAWLNWAAWYEQAFYTRALLDRYVAPLSDAPSRKDQRLSNAKAKEALRRLTASGTDRFDRSADLHSIGSGFFDADKAEKARTTEAGNVPITIGGLPVRNLLSFEYDSRYFLNGGARHCDDMRARCP